MKYFSMFTGIGGFEKGIEQAYGSMGYWRIAGSPELEQRGDKPLSDNSDGYGRRTSPSCIGYSEINKYATQVYSNHYPEHKNYGDATTIDPTQLPDFDLLVGGFPCQAFSIAGKRQGFEDTRGTLFFDIAKILREKRPRHFILENVKGLLSHDNGNTFKTIISTLAELGYSVEWQVLNSKNFGVPQNRERVYIVGHFGGFGRRKVFPIRESNSSTLRQIIRGTQASRVYSTNGVAKTQSCATGGQGAKTGLYAILNKEGGIKPKTIASTLTGGGHSGGNHSDMDLLAIPVLTPDRPEKRQNGRRFKEDGEPSFTLTGQDKHGVFDGVRIRRLTPKECERLQGFPDDWTAGVSDTQRYKCCGNAVTVNVVQAVVERLYA